MGSSAKGKGRTTKSRAPIGLDAEDVVAAAVRWLDEYGPDGVTIDRLSAVLGVSPPTIYWHVGNKAGLWRLVVDYVLDDEDLVVDPDEPWDEQLRRFLDMGRRKFMAHPHVPALMAATVPRVYQAWSRHVLALMRLAGFTASGAGLHARIVLWQLVGFAQMEGHIRSGSVMGEPADDGTGRPIYRVRPEFVDVGDDAALAALVLADFDEQHRTAVDVLIAGLRAAAAR